MRLSFLRLSIGLYLFSLALPMEMDAFQDSHSDYIPGIAAAIGGIFSLSDLFQNPVPFLAWVSNLFLFAGYLTGKHKRTKAQVFAVSAILLVLPMLVTNYFRDVEVFDSPAFLVWFSSHIILVVSAFYRGDPSTEALKSHFKVNGYSKPLFSEEDINQLVPKWRKKHASEVTLEGKNGTFLRINFNPKHAIAILNRHPGDPGLMSIGSHNPPPKSQSFHSGKYGLKRYAGVNAISHDQGIAVLKHFARTGKLLTEIEWEDYSVLPLENQYELNSVPT